MSVCAKFQLLSMSRRTCRGGGGPDQFYGSALVKLNNWIDYTYGQPHQLARKLMLSIVNKVDQIHLHVFI